MNSIRSPQVLSRSITSQVVGLQGFKPGSRLWNGELRVEDAELTIANRPAGSAFSEERSLQGEQGHPAPGVLSAGSAGGPPCGPQ